MFGEFGDGCFVGFDKDCVGDIVKGQWSVIFNVMSFVIFYYSGNIDLGGQDCGMVCWVVSCSDEIMDQFWVEGCSVSWGEIFCDENYW